MSPILAVLAVVVTAGAVIAVSASESRAALVGLAATVCLAPFVAEPLPGAAVLGARVVTGIIVVVLLRAVATGDEGHGLGSRLGWPAESLLAAGAFVAGISIADTLAIFAATGPRFPVEGSFGSLTPDAVALGAGLAAITIGLAPALLSRFALRTGIGLIVLVEGVVLARTGIAGPPGELEQLGINGLVLAAGAAVAVIEAVERRGEPGTGRARRDESAVERGDPPAVADGTGRRGRPRHPDLR
ncbi:MAG: hypothetical protein HYX57_08110 [Chloroflexi bacterium]|nr:hypothetical protein [Chloroflexota bacterium]